MNLKVVYEVTRHKHMPRQLTASYSGTAFWKLTPSSVPKSCDKKNELDVSNGMILILAHFWNVRPFKYIDKELGFENKFNI